MFTDAEYASLDFGKIEKSLKKTFPYCDSLFKKVAIGKSYFIGEHRNNAIKLDLFYTDTFVFPSKAVKNIRFASLEEITAMKLDVIGRGGRKKDFWDLHEFLGNFSLNQMFDFYVKRYLYNFSKDGLLKKIVDFTTAENDFTPNCMRGKSWELIKLDFEEYIENHRK